jgi:hypothetical protein
MRGSLEAPKRAVTEREPIYFSRSPFSGIAIIGNVGGSGEFVLTSPERVVRRPKSPSLPVRITRSERAEIRALFRGAKAH